MIVTSVQIECSNQDSENAKTSLLSCLHKNPVRFCGRDFYFFTSYLFIFTSEKTTVGCVEVISRK